MVINSAGTGGAPLSVGTSTAVQLIAAGNDVDYAFGSSGSDLMCNWGDAKGTAPSPEPTATLGFLFPYIKGTLWKVSGGNAQLRMDCIALTNATNVYTAEDRP